MTATYTDRLGLVAISTTLATTMINIDSRDDLKTLNTEIWTVVFLAEEGRQGVFQWEVGNFTALVAADTAEGLYIKATAISASVGAWVRVRENGPLAMSWFGANGDGTTDNKAAFDGAAAVAKALGGATLSYGRGVFVFASNTAEIIVADTASITIEGLDPEVTVLEFGGTRGLKFTSTSTSDQLRPAFAIKRLSLMPASINMGPAVECAWADADYSYTGFTADQISLRLDSGNFATGFKLTNAKQMHVSRTTMWGDILVNASVNAIELAGDCIVPSFRDVLILGWSVGLSISGTTEGIYGDVVNIVACRGGIRWNGGSGLEPVIALSRSNIHTSLYGIWATNISETSISGCSFYCYGALNSGSAYDAILIDGANTRRWNVFNNSFSTDALGRAGDTKRAIHFATGTGHQTGGNQIFGPDGTFILTHGILVDAGASARVFDDPLNMSNVTNTISGAGTIVAPWRAIRVDSSDHAYLKNAKTLKSRNAAASADIELIGATVNDFVQVGFGSLGIVAAQSVFPLGDNSYDLGFASALWWRNFYLKGAVFHGANQVLSSRRTGWAVATGTATRTTFATGSVTLPQLAERVKALIDDLHGTAGHGLIGT